MVRLCHHRLGPEPVSVRPAFALSLLIRVHLRFHFLAPGAHRRPVWRRNAKLKKAVRTVPCVAESSARHWLNDQSNQRVIGMPLENPSRLAVIPSVGNAERRQSTQRRKGWRFARRSEAPHALPDVLRRPQAIFQFSLRTLCRISQPPTASAVPNHARQSNSAPRSQALRALALSSDSPTMSTTIAPPSWPALCCPVPVMTVGEVEPGIIWPVLVPSGCPFATDHTPRGYRARAVTGPVRRSRRPSRSSRSGRSRRCCWSRTDCRATD